MNIVVVVEETKDLKEMSVSLDQALQSMLTLNDLKEDRLRPINQEKEATKAVEVDL